MSASVMALGIAGKTVAALVPARHVEQSRAGERRDDLLEIFLGKALAVGDILQGHAALPLALGQIDHETHAVAGLRRNLHRGRLSGKSS